MEIYSISEVIRDMQIPKNILTFFAQKFADNYVKSIC